MGKTYKVIGGAVLGTDNKVYQIGDKVDERWINPKLYSVNNGFLAEANEEEETEEAPQGEQDETTSTTTTTGGDEGDNRDIVTGQEVVKSDKIGRAHV